MWPFRKRAPKPPKPSYLDFRIVRTELRNGHVEFHIERFYRADPRLRAEWQLPRVRDPLTAWTFETAEAAQSEIDACLAIERGRETVSETIIQPARTIHSEQAHG